MRDGGQRRAARLASLDDIISRSAPSCPPVASTLHDAAILIYTSGTSGPAKGALHAQRVVPAHTEPISLAHNLFGQEGDVLWSPADWAWGGGLIDCLFASWQAGRPIVAWRPRGFDPDAVIDLIERCAVTNTFLPPTALKRLRDASGIEERARRPAALDHDRRRALRGGPDRMVARRLWPHAE